MANRLANIVNEKVQGLKNLLSERLRLFTAVDMGPPPTHRTSIVLPTGSISSAIPFAGSRFNQTLYVALEFSGTLILWDALAAGRIASGERWRWTTLDIEIRVSASSGASVV